MSEIEHYVVKAPGKLVLLGEYAVLEQGIPSVATALTKSIYCHIRNSKKIIFTSKRININKVEFEYKNNKVTLLSEVKEIDVLAFSKNAMEITLRYLEEMGYKIKPFEINIVSDLSHQYGVKYGFGSSAAVTVSIVAAILYFHGVEINGNVNRDNIFKLSAISHFLSQGSGSGIDIAASTYGGLFIYKSYTSDWMKERLEQLTTIRGLVNETWTHFSYEKINFLIDFYISVGWTGKSASTRHYIQAVNEMRKTEEGEKFYKEFLKATNSIINLFLHGIKNNNHEAINKAVTANRNLLKELSNKAGVVMETDALKNLIAIAKRLGFSAKFSGAGGGDCGYAVMYNLDNENILKNEWQKYGIEPVDVNIEELGVCEIHFANKDKK